MRRVTTAAPSISQRVHSLNRPNMVSVGTIVWLASELMFFAGLFAEHNHAVVLLEWLNATLRDRRDR